VAYLVSEFTPNSASRKFDKVKPNCKLSRKCYCSYSNILISLKIAEFRTPTPQDVQKKGSKILKLPLVHNCFTLTMTNKLVVFINSLKYQKLRKFYHMKWNFLYKLQLPPEPLTKGLPPPDPRPFCPLSSTEFVEPPPEKNSWVCHWFIGNQ